MKRIKKETEEVVTKKTRKKAELKSKDTESKKIRDVQRLVHLLQVHQIELEHQNEELRIAQEELEVSRNKYVNLFDFSPIPYFTLDTDGIIREVNLSASKMFGIDRNKLIGKHFITFTLLAERDIFNLFIKNIFNSMEKQTCELKVVSKNKSVFSVRLEGLKIDDLLETNHQCQVALIDLTEHKRIEHSLVESNENLKSINNIKDKFFSIISHDLKSPFQSLLSSTELLAKEIGNLSKEEVVLFSKGLNDNLKNLYNLLKNLLNWSLMQRNMLDYKPVNLNLFKIVNKKIVITNQSAIKKNISITNNVDTETMVFADDNMLRSVVQNLITNAIKFTNPGGRIIVSSVEKDDFVEVSVQDTGIGIEPEKVLQIFDFSSLTTTNGTTGEKGTGLGLPLCKEFIEKNGGKIWVESDSGNLPHGKSGGSKFYFTLPKAIL